MPTEIVKCEVCGRGFTSEEWRESHGFGEGYAHAACSNRWFEEHPFPPLPTQTAWQIRHYAYVRANPGITEDDCQICHPGAPAPVA